MSELTSEGKKFEVFVVFPNPYDPDEDERSVTALVDEGWYDQGEDEEEMSAYAHDFAQHLAMLFPKDSKVKIEVHESEFEITVY